MCLRARCGICPRLRWSHCGGRRGLRARRGLLRLRRCRRQSRKSIRKLPQNGRPRRQRSARAGKCGLICWRISSGALLENFEDRGTRNCDWILRRYAPQNDPGFAVYFYLLHNFGAELFLTVAGFGSKLPLAGGDAVALSTLSGSVRIHDGTRPWIGLALAKPTCGVKEIELAFGKREDGTRTKFLK